MVLKNLVYIYNKVSENNVTSLCQERYFCKKILCKTIYTNKTLSVITVSIFRITPRLEHKFLFVLKENEICH